MFLAQTLGYAVVDPLMWIGALPILATLFYSAGYGWNALPLGAVCALYLSLLLASIRVASETWLRKKSRSASVKNFQALFTVLGTLGLFLLSRIPATAHSLHRLLGYAEQTPPP